MLKHLVLCLWVILACSRPYFASGITASDPEANKKNAALRGRAIVGHRKLQDSLKCNCISCTEEVLNTLAAGYSCGSRIDWVVNNREVPEYEACSLVAGDEFPSECGGCNPNLCSDEEEEDPTPSPPNNDNAFECGCDSCTEEVWNTLAGDYTCGSRITWLENTSVDILESYGISGGPFNKASACQSVSEEFPDICTCNPTTCGDTPSTDTPTSKSTSSPTKNPTPPPTSSPTVSPTSTPTARPTSTPTSKPTVSPTNLPTASTSQFCGCDSCTDDVLNSFAGDYRCGDRIEWVFNNRGMSQEESCKIVADEYPSICGPCHSDTCGDIPPTTPPSTSSPIDDSPDDIEWDGTDLTLTHYWDCSGQSCDATTLSPWDYSKYRAPTGYQPQDPNDFGGPSKYGEKLWVTAAIMNIDQGSDDGCCGATSQGGCGNCILISNPDSLKPDWAVMAMKKNTCGNCRENPHADINVPGFDVLQYSLANICGEAGTGLSKEQSTTLGEWYKDYSNIAEAGAALCDQLPEEFQKGCNLFSEWGWTGGTTSRARYKVVDCPDQFKEHIGSLFDENGVIDDPVPITPPIDPTPSPDAPSAQCGCTSCTDEVLDTLAGDNSCRSRINWLQANEGMSVPEACIVVGDEFPSICGACHSEYCGDFPPTSAPVFDGTVTAMSYNTEYTGYYDGRVPSFGAKIAEVNPDVVGAQECQDPNALASASGYSLLDGTGPQNYILYNPNRVAPVTSGWMDIPRDNYAQRTITWGKFRILETGSEFWFFNTHLPHNGDVATDRNTHARIGRSLIAKREELGAANVPTIVVGDCNPFASSGASEGSFESNVAAGGIPKVYEGRGNTGGYGGLDKIFASAGDWTTVSASDRGTGRSDHPAIAAVLALN